jgi:CheY-like chemotaxis protein
MGTCTFSRTVVVRDRNEEVLQIIKDFLEPLGCTVVLAESAVNEDKQANRIEFSREFRLR